LPYLGFDVFALPGALVDAEPGKRFFDLARLDRLIAVRAVDGRLLHFAVASDDLFGVLASLERAVVTTQAERRLRRVGA
jgi:hypothetical protein